MAVEALTRGLRQRRAREPGRAALDTLIDWLMIAAAVLLVDLVLGAAGWIPSLPGHALAVAAVLALYVLAGGGRTLAGGLAAVAAAVALVLVLHSWPNGERKQFVRAVRAIEPGMRLEQVDALLVRFRRGHPYGERFAASAPEWTYWHSNSRTWDFDHCRVRCGDAGEVRAIELVLD